jgi:hypothetical protein
VRGERRGARDRADMRTTGCGGAALRRRRIAGPERLGRGAARDSPTAVQFSVVYSH